STVHGRTLNPTAPTFVPGQIREEIPTTEQLTEMLAAATASAGNQTPRQHIERAQAEQRYINAARAANRAKLDEMRKQLEDEQMGRGSNWYELQEDLFNEIKEAETLQVELGERYRALDDVVEAAQIASVAGEKEVDMSWGSGAR
ncbi:MAG: hypothetical protein Q9164_007647, partial [Protoblastenia rupestris]